MSFNITIQNIGKLDHAKIRIGQFTILAGPNNTGKSTVSKLLYSVFNGMNANHALSHFQRLTQPIRESLASPIWWPPDNEPRPLDFLDETLSKMEELLRAIEIDNIDQIEDILPTMRRSVDVLCQQYTETQVSIKAEWEKSDPDSKAYIENVCQLLDENLHSLRRHLDEESGTTFVLFGLQEQIQENVLMNFQVPELSSLRANNAIPGHIMINGMATFSLTGEQLSVDKLMWSGMARLQQYSRVIYLESPSYWKFKTAFEAIKFHPRFHYTPRRQRISSVPQYIYDVFRAMRDEYTGEVPFGHIAEKLISEQVMNGKLVLSENGEVQFQENDRLLPLSMTAMGVINLGIMALLMECRILDEGTFLFIDEPESHLHPAWQHVMAETLFALARHGVNVVIATHSPDILKAVETHLNRCPEEKELMAVNWLSPLASDNDTLESKLAKIQGELTDPYAIKYLEGL